MDLSYGEKMSDGLTPSNLSALAKQKELNKAPMLLIIVMLEINRIQYIGWTGQIFDE